MYPQPHVPQSSPSYVGMTHAIYALLALTFFSGGLTTLIAIIIHYIKVDEVQNTWIASHFRWQIRTIWFGLLWLVIGGILTLFIIGFLILFINFIWMIYRVIKGWLLLSEGRPIL